MGGPDLVRGNQATTTSTHSQLPHGDPLVRIFLQQLKYQVSKLGLLLVVDDKLVIANRVVQLRQTVFGERDSAIAKAVQRDAHGPDISSATRDETVLGDTQLWRHKGRRARVLRSRHCRVLVKHFRNAKINNLEDIVFGHQAVVGLDVSVDNALSMHWRYENERQ